MKHGLLGKTVTEAELCGGVQVAIRSLVALAVGGLRSRLLVAVFTCGVAVLLCVRVAYAGSRCDGAFWRVVSQVTVDGAIKQSRCRQGAESGSVDGSKRKRFKRLLFLVPAGLASFIPRMSRQIQRTLGTQIKESREVERALN